MAQNPYGPQTGLLGLLGAGGNPIYRSLKDGGLLDSLAYGLASGTGLADGLQKAALLQIGGQNNRQERALKAAEWDEKQQQQNATKALLTKEAPDLAQLLDTGIPMGEVWGEYLRRKNPTSTQPQNPYMSAGDGNFFNWQTGEFTSNPNAAADGGGDLTTGFTPIWGTVDGKPTVALPGNDGKFYIDGNPIDSTKFVPTNPYDLNAQKAGGRAFGTATGGTQFSVPSAALELKQSVDAIGNLQADDVKAGMEDWFKQWGALPRGAWVQGGSNMAKFQNAANNIIDRSWLSARAMLKGAGQVTDYEGTKAENAVSMMKTALEKGDKASYEEAVKDYEYWIQQGFAKIQQQAGAMDGYGGNQQPATGGGNQTSTGVPWSIEP